MSPTDSNDVLTDFPAPGRPPRRVRRAWWRASRLIGNGSWRGCAGSWPIPCRGPGGRCARGRAVALGVPAPLTDACRAPRDPPWAGNDRTNGTSSAAPEPCQPGRPALVPGTRQM